MADSTRNVAILGATGSIGQAAIDVVASLGEPWKTWGISGHRRVDVLQDSAKRCCPSMVACTDDAVSEIVVPDSAKLLRGPDALISMASANEVDVVVAAIVGSAGLESTLAALEAGKRVALANKEALVVAGPLMRERLSHGGELLPVDSEHSAIFQCLPVGDGQTKVDTRQVRRLILTSSGGPFRQWSAEQIASATVENALNHPTWEMGDKITIDSATMMNKGLEVIEACWLFDLPPSKIDVVVHPQSIIHSMVEYDDGSVLAQMSPPDMRLPIQYALTYPNRVKSIAPDFDLTRAWELSLEPADFERFPALPLAFEVAEAGGTAGAVLNAANEKAVELFLNEQIGFTDIVPACRRVLENHEHESSPSLSRLMELDRWARSEVQRWSCSTHS